VEKNNERKKAESAFKNAAFIGYLVKKLKQQSKRQVGKTKIQKLVYLLTREGIADFDYSMHYYGPYSTKVAEELSIAEKAEIIQSRQNGENRGFFLSVDEEKEGKFEYLLKDDEMAGIDAIVDKFGRFDAKELSIISTYHFLNASSDLTQEELVIEIHKIKNYREQDIRRVLERAAILN
jgi:uncharacterized protein YwgA